MWHGDEKYQLEESRSRFLELNNEQFNGHDGTGFFQ